MTRTLPYFAYSSPTILEQEMRQLFRRSWQYVGHVGMFVDDVRSRPTEVGGVPVVLTSTGQETKAFVNVCAHRGSIVCKEPSTRDSLTCPYHAWRYGLDGQLLSAPRSNREPGFDPSDHFLEELPIGRWGPFMFVAPDPGALPFDEFLGDLPERVKGAGIEVESLVFNRRVDFTLAANWKLCAENFLECYHCRVAHPDFAKAIDTDADSYLLDTSDTFSTQIGPVRDKNTIIDLSGEIERSQFHLLYPNTAINILAGQPNLSIGPILPETPNSTTRFLDYFFGPDVADDWIESMLAFDDQVGAEDKVLVEDMQNGLDARPQRTGVLFMDSEHLISHFEDHLRSLVRYQEDS